jgi:hypothetical protein
MENIVTGYAVVITSIILWNFFKTQKDLKSRVEALEQDLNTTTDGVYRTIQDTKHTIEDSISDLNRELGTEVASLYRTIQQVEEARYSSKK